MDKDEIESMIYAIDYTLLAIGAGPDHKDAANLDVVQIEKLWSVRAKLIAEYGEEITLRPAGLR